MMLPCYDYDVTRRNFQLHHNLMGPLSYMLSVINLNVIMWPMTVFALLISQDWDKGVL